jgi:hypothetical protein
MGRYHKNLLYEADIYFVQGDYYYASELYTELCKIAPNDGELLGKLGICHFNLPTMKTESERFLSLAVENGDEESRYYLALSRIEQYRFYEALELLAGYEQFAGRTRSDSEIKHLQGIATRAIRMVQAPVPVTIKNLGENVNSALHDYAPVWDSEGNKLYFTSRRRYDDESEKDISEQYDENIYFVDLASDEMRAFAAPAPLNTRTNDAAVACSEDGKSLMVFRTRKDGFSGDLYQTEKNHYAWGELNKLSSQINSKHHEASASFGKEGTKELFFSSDRPGGFGGKDIYRVSMLPNGTWGEPQNLGEEINTAFDEDAPFIAADGSLYFASTGHETMGGYDIFCAIPDGFSWKKPINLGYPINTPGDDVFFNLDKSGKVAYFSSERLGGHGLQDIYKVEFNEENSIIYRGEIQSEGMKLDSQATVTLLNADDGEIEGMYQVDPEIGTFVMALSKNKNYTVLVEADGYKPFEKDMFFETGAGGAQETISENLVLSK